MRAAIFQKYGSASELKIQSMEQPHPGPTEVLIKIHASSINPIDWKLRNGLFLLRLIFGLIRPRKTILGIDFAGEIVELGKAANKFKLQDQVFGAIPGGAYAEYVCAEETKIFHKPPFMSFQDASGVPLAGLTALQALRNKGGIRPNHNVLVYGASGGVGAFAVQLANSFGANVTGVCSKRNIPLVKSLGAKVVMDRAAMDHELLESQYDIIFDAAGKASYGEFKKHLKREGIYITSTPHIKDLLPMVLTLVGKRKARTLITHLNSQDLAILSKNIQQGVLRTVIDSIYPLDEIVSAHQYAEQGHSAGKVILQITHDE